MQSFNIFPCIDIFKWINQDFDSWNFIQYIIVKITEWSSSLCRSFYKDSNNIYFIILWVIFYFLRIFKVYESTSINKELLTSSLKLTAKAWCWACFRGVTDSSGEVDSDSGGASDCGAPRTLLLDAWWTSFLSRRSMATCRSRCDLACRALACGCSTSGIWRALRVNYKKLVYEKSGAAKAGTIIY
jgi:hypothetical protein